MHILIIESTPEKLKKHRWKLWRMGFAKETPKQYISSAASDRRVRHIKRYCEQNKLRFRIKNSYGARSGNYRKSFIKAYEPTASRNRWYCAYCGKKLSERKLVVDHLYPIHQVSKNLRLQDRLRRRGIANVNSPENLVPSCAKCNSKKGIKIGLWVVRGQLGRNGLIWKIRDFLKWLIITYLIFKALKEGLVTEYYTKLSDYMWIKHGYNMPDWFR